MSDIQNLFHASSPDDPDTAAWAEKVHARRRRNRTLTGVAGGALVVALAVPAGISLLNMPNRNVAQPASGSTPTQTADAPSIQSAADACAAAPAQTEGWSELTGGDSPLKLGAEKAWFCGDDGTVGPSEPLTVGVDELAQAFLDAEEADPNQPCTMEYRLAYTIAFQYADGTLVPVTGELHGCRTLSEVHAPDGTTSTGPEVSPYTHSARLAVGAQSRIALLSPGDLLIWDRATGEETRFEDLLLQRICWSPDESTLYTLSEAEGISAWDGKEWRQFELP